MLGIRLKSAADAKQRHSTNRHKSRFQCKTCGFTAHSDINAATNIKDDYILSTAQSESVEQGSVNDPYVSTSSAGSYKLRAETPSFEAGSLPARFILILQPDFSCATFSWQRADSAVA
jgi:hypothetical protein